MTSMEISPSPPRTLFHGTTASRAAVIQEHGFVAPDIEAELRQLADEHTVDFEKLWKLLDEESFLGLRLPNTVYFSEQKSTAEDYAQWAPEYLYHGRAFIFRLKHPEVPERWYDCDELLWSLFRLRIDDPPVVLTVSFPADAISEKVLRARPDQEMYGQVDVPVSPSLVNDTATVVSAEKFPLQLRSDLARFCADGSLTDGEFGPATLDDV
ncbi:uncharacterized protein METZ01_LOCUS463294, partial [marine metagenome]